MDIRFLTIMPISWVKKRQCLSLVVERLSREQRSHARKRRTRAQNLGPEGLPRKFFRNLWKVTSFWSLAAFYVALVSPYHAHAQRSEEVLVEDHLLANPVFRDLLQPGPEAHNGLDYGIQLRAPAFPDGLNTENQLAAIDQVLTPAFSRELFLRGKISDLPVIRRDFEKPKGKRDFGVSVIDVYFVTPGNLAIFAQRDLVESLIGISEKAEAEENITELTDQQLRDVGIQPNEIDKEHEAFRIVHSKLMDTVVLKGVSRTYWTQTDESVVLAIALDRRFDQQAELQARWDKLIQLADGTYDVDTTGKSYCIGVYLKITTLAGQPNQLLVEGHGVIIQPKIWFRGRDSIGDKLPSAIKQRVPDIRRKLEKALSAG